ncbi:hypothetical protein ODJ79_42215 [Actinoplanes sp. KI2]|uniref:hypothetical protein n=1 Tax=Actinoplanes sp. KI2 TaxID=2983315 RepID=UPI0021D5CAC8|nr:hypothetical protein [Actinoplanes sp. KI2]MCU7730374.1 hypothetical protein [Actinoplanes sp. KI2]
MNPPTHVHRASVLLAGCAVLAGAIVVIAMLAWRHLGPAGIRYLMAEPDGGVAVHLVRAALEYSLVVGTATVLITSALALVVRRPLVWARWVAWCVLGAIAVLLLLGLSAGDVPLAAPGAHASAVDGLFYDLVPHWYPSVSAVLGLALMVLVLTAAVLLTRSSAADYYRPASSVQDPRWAAFVEAQQRRIAGD